MRPGDTAYLIVRVLNAGVAVTGLVTANFTVTGYLSATTPVISFTATEISAGYYRLAVTLPGSAGWCTLLVASGSYTVQQGRYFGEIELQDADSTYDISVRPVVSVTGASALASEVTLELIANRYANVAYSIVDQAGAVVDLSGYNNFRFTVWDKTHTGGASLYVLSTGITGSAGGALAFAIPEGAAFFSQITAAITAGDDSVTLYYDVVADKAATAAQSVSLVRGKLLLLRFEGAV